MPTRQGGTWWWVRYDPDLPVFKASTRPSPQWEVAKWEGGRWYFTGDEARLRTALQQMMTKSPREPPLTSKG